MVFAVSFLPDLTTFFKVVLSEMTLRKGERLKNKTKMILGLTVLLAVPLIPYQIYAKDNASQNADTALQQSSDVSVQSKSLSTSEISLTNTAYSATEVDTSADTALAYQVEFVGNVEKIQEPVVSAAESFAMAVTDRSKSATTSITRFTRYGVDCSGCKVSADGFGGTASGVSVSTTSVKQSNGVWKQGITYDGYYIIAMDKNIPMRTIVEISNHNLSGAGIEPGVPFKAIVLDRGGAVDGLEVDLFVGTEKRVTVSGSATGASITILE